MKTLADRLLADRVVEKIWSRDVSAWNATPGSADARSISTRLGWLDVGETMPPHLGEVNRLAEEVRREGFDQVAQVAFQRGSFVAQRRLDEQRFQGRGVGVAVGN